MILTEGAIDPPAAAGVIVRPLELRPDELVATVEEARRWRDRPA